ncbi:MAG: polyphosphate kinase 2 [Gammaproteobacteria bacterium]
MGKKRNKKKNHDATEATDSPLGRKEYTRELRKLQVGLCDLQDWVKQKKLKVAIVFEGRDAAGKGGTIKAITEKVSPRVFRIVALPAPSEREKTQIYGQRYIEQLPAGGEIVMFDRSWYNRAGVEPVMGFCTEEETDHFLATTPVFEKMIVDAGVILLKYWLEVSNEEQERRFRRRINDPLRQWKLSPMDLEARRRWYAYSRARDKMMAATDMPYAPWYLIRSDDKRRARLNCIHHLLSKIPHEDIPHEKVKLPPRSKKDEYDDQASLEERYFIPEVY